MLCFDVKEKQSKFEINHRKVLENLSSLPIYPHQKEALRKISDYFQAKSKPNIALVVLPTGSGKSGIAALAPYILSSSRVLVITPSIIITKQLFQDFCDVSNEGKTFYEERKILRSIDKNHFVEVGFMMEKTDQIANMNQYNLVIANAHKFGQTANVDISRIPKKFDLVIVDEAHHYPAPTWKNIVDHFSNTKKIFLTATPKHRGKDILKNQTECICFQLSRSELMNRNVIRSIEFIEVGKSFQDSFQERAMLVGDEIHKKLEAHDDIEPDVEHQAMIITCYTQEVDDCVDVLNQLGYGDIAAGYYSRNKMESLKDFLNGDVKILVVCGKLLEGFDHKRVSVVGILRNISPQSKVLFSQFVGRCVRKMAPNENITSYVISHVAYKQKANFKSMDDLAESDPEDDEC